MSLANIVFEIVIVFVGVTAAFALEAARQESARMRNIGRACLARLRPTLHDTIEHNRLFEAEVDKQLGDFDAATAQAVSSRKFRSIASPARSGRRRAYGTGSSAQGRRRRSIPTSSSSVAILYTRLDSFGEQYIRYNDYHRAAQVAAEGQHNLESSDPATGRLKPEYVAYVNRLRDLEGLAKQLDAQAAMLKTRLDALQ